MRVLKKSSNYCLLFSLNRYNFFNNVVNPMDENRKKALGIALSQIEKQFGKGSVMRMGDTSQVPVEAISTGSLTLDVALGIGGLPRGRIVEIYGPESSGKTTLTLQVIAACQRQHGGVQLLWMQNMH